ncbi:hypothetical protein HWI79_3601 [Cryptosporidium felis]|nr:hypothetical protein HWI79_3601 [Cryptosporidium felis]
MCGGGHLGDDEDHQALHGELLPDERYRPAAGHGVREQAGNHHLLPASHQGGPAPVPRVQLRRGQAGQVGQVGPGGEAGGGDRQVPDGDGGAPPRNPLGLLRAWLVPADPSGRLPGLRSRLHSPLLLRQQREQERRSSEHRPGPPPPGQEERLQGPHSAPRVRLQAQGRRGQLPRPQGLQLRRDPHRGPRLRQVPRAVGGLPPGLGHLGRPPVHHRLLRDLLRLEDVPGLQRKGPGQPGGVH